jgi:hypothetical protein
MQAFFVRHLPLFMAGRLMRSFIKLSSIAIILGCVAGCHHWQKRRVDAVSYSDCCNPSVGSTSIVAPANGIGSPPVVSKVLPSTIPSAQYP